MNHSYKTVVHHTCLLGEGPVWDEKKSMICWVDILNGSVHQYTPVSKKHEVIEVGKMVGCIALTTDGDFIAGLENGIALLDRQSGKLKMIANPEKDLVGNRFNDGKCDADGRFWAGTMSITEEEKKGALYRIDHSGSFSKMISDVSISNGLAWSLDNKTFYYIDTPTQKVVAYDFDLRTGDIKNKRTVFWIPDDEGSPDGMTIDADGMLWVAHWDGWQVSRWNPSTGEKLFHFTMPVPRITSCTFGGEKLDDLYITTASVGLEHDETSLAGSLFIIKNSGFRGLPAVEFSGKL